jgi:uncharacterized protein YqjF (DUF2071 family)
MQKVFLAAEWKNLIMANYEVDPAILQKYVPNETELDSWKGKTFVSMVGFMFLNTKVLGLPIPFHRDFEEVNLRFYVRYKDDSEWKRGVVFIKEIVPKSAIAFVANNLYGENYQSLPMKNELSNEGDSQIVSYSWKFQNDWNYLKVNAATKVHKITEGSEAEFVTEHYWGYTSGKHKTTLEYQVEHPRWGIFPVNDFEMHCDVAPLYGKEFESFLNLKPNSVFMADGSEIIVRQGRKIN